MINRGFLVLIQIAKKYVRKFTQKELYRPFAVNFVVVVVSRSLSVQNSSMNDDNAIFFHNIFVCFFFYSQNEHLIQHPELKRMLAQNFAFQVQIRCNFTVTLRQSICIISIEFAN